MRVVVIGAGISGTLVGRELAQAGHDVTVLEARHVGAGSSSRTAAGIRQQFSTPGTVQGMRYSVAFYKAFAQQTADGVSPIVQNGYLFLHGDDAALDGARARAAMQQEAGLTEVEVLSRTAIADRFPWLAADTLAGATHCPSDGFLLPQIIYQEAARHLTEAGGRLLQNAPVTEARFNGRHLTQLLTPKGTFDCDLVIDCSNAWTPRLGRILQGTELPVFARKRYLWFVKRDAGFDAATLAHMPLTITPSGTYFRPENADTLMFGHKHDAEAENTFDYADQDFIEPAFSHNGGIDARPFELWAGLAEMFPAVGEFDGLVATTSGYYAETPDHNPFLGYDPAVGNLIRLVGFSGHGAMMGPFTARVAHALVDAGHNLSTVELEDGVVVSLDAFAFDRSFEAREQMVI
ncbi:MAG: FAD-binding oxidoreductase [Myxococcota bacterium]